MTQPILPGAALGILGSGQLGRMCAIAARRLGYRVHVLSPESDTPTGQVADIEESAPYTDLDAVAAFARRVAVVTFEFENVPLATVEAAGRYVPIRPAGDVLHTTQHRLREKTFLRTHGFPTTPFAAIRNAADIDALPSVLTPGVLKTAAWGYDGKGQSRVSSAADVRRVWTDDLHRQEAILEQWVDFEKELSVVGVRGVNGEVACYEPIENLHRHHILDVSIAPARIEARVARDAVDLARAILTKLQVVGVLCVELFLTRDGQLLVNELAPRPHNSGHLTIDAHVTCQFEQQVRAVCGLPLGAVDQRRPAAMVNLLGDLWADREPDWPAALAHPSVKLHLYGKRDAKPGRKMGHLTVTGQSQESAIAAALAARQCLVGQSLPEPA